MALGHLYEEAWTCDAEAEVAEVIREFVNLGAPPHLLAVRARLDERRRDEAVALLPRLTAAAVDPLTLDGHLAVVLGNTQRRLASRARDILHGGLQSGEETNELLHQARQLLDRAESATVRTRTNTDAAHAITEQEKLRRENPGQLVGHATGWPEWDKLTLGLTTGHMHVIGGRQSHGKSLCASALCVTLGFRHVPTLVFALEMSHEEWLKRMACAMAGVSIHLWDQGSLKTDLAARVNEQLAEIATWPITIIDQASVPTATQIFSYAAHWSEQHPQGVIIIDYVQLMSLGEKYKDRTEEVGEISRRWTLLAGRTDTAVVLTSQLKRDSSGEPEIKDLSQASQLESDAYTVSLLWRPVKDKNPPEDAAFNQGFLLLKKNRGGPDGTQLLHFSDWCVRFRPWRYDHEDANGDVPITDDQENRSTRENTIHHQRRTS